MIELSVVQLLPTACAKNGPQVLCRFGREFVQRLRPNNAECSVREESLAIGLVDIPIRSDLGADFVNNPSSGYHDEKPAVVPDNVVI